jgi:hypothetical protein
MTADDVFRAVLGVLPTYVQREGHSTCTTCGAVVGGASSDQIRHTTWHHVDHQRSTAVGLDNLHLEAPTGMRLWVERE